MIEAMKPCPFCGGEAHRIPGTNRVAHQYTGCILGGFQAKVPEWNRRALIVTDAMVETAAAAIDAEWADEPNRDPPFDELDVAYKNHCRATARAALEAVFGATEKT